MPGTYNERVAINKSGTADNYITLTSYDLNNKAKIDGSGMSGGATITVDSGQSYVKVIGFEENQWS